MEPATMNLISLFFTAISSIGTLIAAVYAAISANRSKKSLDTTIILEKQKREEKLKDELNRILEIGIEYPYFESKPFTELWTLNKSSQDEKYLRYDMYCNLIFNYLNHVFEHFDKNKTKVEDFVDIKTWIRLHKYNWENPVDENENIDGYGEDFRKFINSYIKA